MNKHYNTLTIDLMTQMAVSERRMDEGMIHIPSKTV